jgi:hypothetical protein
VTGALFLVMAAWAGGPPEGVAGAEAAVEIRALRGYLGLYRESLEKGSGPSTPWVVEMARDLRQRLDRLLDSPDLSGPSREEAVQIYLGFARAVSTPAPAGKAAVPRGAGLEWVSGRELYAEAVKRAEAAGLDPLPLELEMLQSPGVGLDPRETYRRLARRLARLHDGTGLGAEEKTRLRAVVRRLLQTPSWPDLEEGDSLSGAVELLFAHGGGDEREELDAIASKLKDWTERLIAGETATEGELARSRALIHLYRALLKVGRRFDAAQLSGALKGLEPLAPPSIAPGPPGGEGLLRSVEIRELRLVAATAGTAGTAGPETAKGGAGGWEAVLPLPAELFPGLAARHFLVPGKAYQIELACLFEGGAAPVLFRLLGRGGEEARLVLPRSIPPGMVPVTSAESGRLAFLADRRPWSIRRFLLALQRSWNGLAGDPSAAAGIYRATVLRELPLPEGGEPSLAAVVGLLSLPRVAERLEETFWVDAGDEAGRVKAFEIAAAVLTGNSGLRNTRLALPTVAEANRLFRDGAHFGLEETSYGLFNATRLVPEPRELGGRPRYAIRAVLDPASP